MAWQRHRDAIYARIVEAGFRDITRAQFDPFRWPGVNGMRPGEIADALQLSKQTVNDLLGELESNGYVERRADPTDGRARVIHLTRKGHDLQRAAHEISRELEQAWSGRVGEKEFAALRGTLVEMVSTGLPGAPPPPTGMESRPSR